jgi:hypothetical protein
MKISLRALHRHRIHPPRISRSHGIAVRRTLFANFSPTARRPREADELIDKLVGDPEFIDHWANKWADLLQVNSKFLGKEGAESFRDWIRGEVEQNTPYDQLARKILTASGSNRENPPASYWKILRTPTEANSPSATRMRHGHDVAIPTRARS